MSSQVFHNSSIKMTKIYNTFRYFSGSYLCSMGEQQTEEVRISISSSSLENQFMIFVTPWDLVKDQCLSRCIMFENQHNAILPFVKCGLCLGLWLNWGINTYIRSGRCADDVIQLLLKAYLLQSLTICRFSYSRRY